MWNLQVGSLPDTRERVLLPEGEYRFIVEDAKTGYTKAQAPKLDIVLSCLAHNFQGACIYDTLNLGHGSIKAREIALSQLKAYLVAMGYPSEYVFQHNEALIGREVMVLVGVEPEKDQYPAKNKVLKVRSVNEAQPVASQAPLYPPLSAPTQEANIPF